MQECFRCANVLHAPMNVESGMRAPKSIFTWHGNLSKRIRCSSPGAGLLHDSSEIHHTIPAGQYSCSQQSNPLKRPHRVAWLRGNAIHSPLQDSHVRYNSAMPLPTDEVHIWWLEADEVDPLYSWLTFSSKQDATCFTATEIANILWFSPCN